jgi:hypothetical protein
VVLLANVILLTALLSMLHASLSLPGIAGIILTVGIAVDANVLIYERIREELRNGVSPQAADPRRLRQGVLGHRRFERDRAVRRSCAGGHRHRRHPQFRHRADAGHCDLDVHLAARQPGADHADVWRPAQGGAPVDRLTRLIGTTTTVEFFHRATSFPFMSTRKVWYGLSIVLMLISVASLATRGLNLGVDFTGGVTVQATSRLPPIATR